MSSPRRLLAACLLLATCALVSSATSGCAATFPPAPPTSLTPVPVSDSDCVRSSGGNGTPATGPHLVVVVDPTASRRSGGWPSVVRDAVVTAARAGGRLTIVGMNGAGAPPTVVWSDRVLLPPGVRGTPREARVLPIVLACAERDAASAEPTTAGTDVVAGIDAGAGSFSPGDRGGRLMVLTDGWSTAGELQFDRGVDVGDSPPDAVAASLVDAGALTSLRTLDVTVVGVGDLRVGPVPETVHRWLEQLYEAMCTRGGAAHCAVLRDGGENDPTPGRPRPDDPVTLPPVLPAVVSVGPDTTRLSGSEFFEPGSARLRAGAENALRSLAEGLRPGSGRRADVVGHVASWGTAAYRETLAADRAGAVCDALVALGADPAAIGARGAGSTEPLVPDLSTDGQLDPAAAARNRRVDVDVRAGTS